MKYVSPYQFIEAALKRKVDDIDASTIQQVRKILFAEFELNESVTITIEGKQYDKAGILQVLDRLERTWEYHQKINNDPNLLAFLNEGELKLPFEGFNENYKLNEPFVEFLAPYYSDQYSEKLHKYYKGKDIHLVELMQEVPLLVNEGQIDFCYFKVARSILISINELKLLNAKSSDENEFKRISDKEISSYSTPPKIDLLNALPEYFYGLRNDFAMELYQLSIACYNIKRKRWLAASLLKAALHLKTDDYVRVVLEDLKNQYQKLGYHSLEKDYDTKTFYPVFFLIVAFLFIGINFQTCESTIDQVDVPLTQELMLDNVHPGVSGQGGSLFFFYGCYEADTTMQDSFLLETGDVVYQHLFSLDTIPDTVMTHEMTVKNESAYDAVVLLNNGTEIRNYFIAANDSFLVDHFPLEGKYYVSLYRGKQWDKNALVAPQPDSCALDEALAVIWKQFKSSDTIYGAFAIPLHRTIPVEFNIASLSPVDKTPVVFPADSAAGNSPIDSTEKPTDTAIVEPDPEKDYTRSILRIKKDNTYEVGNRVKL